MERIFNVGKTLRNNWKKSIFFSVALTWGGKWLYDREIEFQVMRAYCQEAIKYGEHKIAPMSLSRHVTVILNPAANKRKAKADYEKYCAPILHLAGLKVSLIQTEAEGQAKDLMEIMSNTDCVLIAGGDGTVHEAITGLIRRQESPEIKNDIPIGIAPIGKRNLIASRLNHFDKNDRKAKIIGESTMSLVREVLHDVNVMKIESDLGRPVYSLGTINIGQIRNTFSKLNEYWYFGERAKPYLTFFFQSFRNLSDHWNEHEDINVRYTELCSGCSKCYQNIYPTTSVNRQIMSNYMNVNSSNYRWWHSLLSRRVEPTKKTPKDIEIDRIKNIENPNCQDWKIIKINSKNILIQNNLEKPVLEMCLHSEDMERMDFIREGIRFSKQIDFIKNNQELLKNSEKIPFTMISGKEFKLELMQFSDESNQKMVKKEMFDEKNNNEQTVVYSEPLENISKKESFNENLGNNPAEKIQISLKRKNIHVKNETEEEINSVVRKNEGIQELDDSYSSSFNKDVNSEAINNHDEEKENGKSNEEEDYDTKLWLSIDNENYETSKNLSIQLLQKRLQIYASKI